MRIVVSIVLVVILSSCAFKESARFIVKDGAFQLDDQPIQLMCGEMHYPRIPKEYWQDRLKRAKAMGLNTVSAYVFWNFHERQPGVFDFEGQADIRHFIELAQQEGLYVILRPGPYVCAEWDFGGYPSWLLKEKDMVYRSNDERFLLACDRYIQRLGEELADLTIENGGPILMVQVENEYGSYGNDKVYLGKLRDMIKSAGFNTPLMTCDGSGQMEAGFVEGTITTVNGAVGEDIFKSVDRFHDGGPYFVAEFYPAWFDVWGQKHSYRDYKKPTEQLAWMAENGVSVSIYMFHGGTNFFYTNGANNAYGYAPQPTSYDYDAPLGEYGNEYEKYFAFRDVLQDKLYKSEKLPPVPEPNPVITIPSIELVETAPLSEAFNQRIASEMPMSMEDVDQDFGYIHYETIINEPISGKLTIKDVRDYAVILINGKQVGSLDRRHLQSSINIDIKEVPAKLEIVVENVGRINYGADILNNRKGITEKVSINGKDIAGWMNTPMPLYKAKVGDFNYSSGKTEGVPAFHKATFKLRQPGDTFLDLSKWGKGAAWINGRSLGKFWNIGPQQTLYVPGPWLNEGDNELVIFTLEDTGARTVEGLAVPILDQIGDDINAKKRTKHYGSKTPVLELGDRLLEVQMKRENGWQDFNFSSVKTLRHLAIEAISGYTDSFACLTELEIIGEDGDVLTKDTWEILYTNSEEVGEGHAELLIDNNISTYWHSKWSKGNDKYPHKVIIDLGEILSVKGIRLRQRDMNKPGAVKDINIYGRPQFFLFE
ncbi:beta-galactosidase [Carboxylicivirga sediminis]|uniref:Beta-galactosidase n=1 Tax=Carboxylicivirga sediminis TaxID=2006564 RepID=A0A941F2C1_9BACT|nr:beta-galactosidase [Carboxylicivirga sediminis]MBR8535072.1 beta-galactosidase [Carboxylicivirga sediminis]